MRETSLKTPGTRHTSLTSLIAWVTLHAVRNTHRPATPSRSMFCRCPGPEPKLNTAGLCDQRAQTSVRPARAESNVMHADCSKYAAATHRRPEAQALTSDHHLTHHFAWLIAQPVVLLVWLRLARCLVRSFQARSASSACLLSFPASLALEVAVVLIITRVTAPVADSFRDGTAGP